MFMRLSKALSLGSFAVSLLFAIPHLATAQSQEPLTLLTKIQLPGIDGDFDHFAYDLKRNRLIVAAEEHHTLELFDLKTGKHLQSISGFKAPHSIAYVPESDELFVTDGEDASCLILSASDFHRVSRIPLRAGPMQRSTIRQANVTTSATVAVKRRPNVGYYHPLGH